MKDRMWFFLKRGSVCSWDPTKQVLPTNPGTWWCKGRKMLLRPGKKPQVFQPLVHSDAITSCRSCLCSAYFPCSPLARSGCTMRYSRKLVLLLFNFSNLLGWSLSQKIWLKNFFCTSYEMTQITIQVIHRYHEGSYVIFFKARKRMLLRSDKTSFANQPWYLVM